MEFFSLLNGDDCSYFRRNVFLFFCCSLTHFTVGKKCIKSSKTETQTGTFWFFQISDWASSLSSWLLVLALTCECPLLRSHWSRSLHLPALFTPSWFHPRWNHQDWEVSLFDQGHSYLITELWFEPRFVWFHNSYFLLYSLEDIKLCSFKTSAHMSGKAFKKVDI